MQPMRQLKRKSRRMTPPMLASKYSGSERLEATAANFPALKNFWGMDSIVDRVLYDSVGNKDLHGTTDEWVLTEEGYSKLGTEAEILPVPTEKYEAPGDRDFMLLGCATLRASSLGNMRLVTVGGNGVYSDPLAAGISFNPRNLTGAISAYLDSDNYAANATMSFASTPNRTTAITGCYAVVVSPTAGTVTTHWAGRNDDEPAYEVSDTLASDTLGSIQATWPAIGAGWTCNPDNRLEWTSLLMFESGAPKDMEEAMKWMAQHDDIRLYPGWKGKK